VRTAELSLITEHDDLHVLYVNQLGATELQAFQNACADSGQSSGFVGKLFSDIFREFLEEAGAPCPEMLNSLHGRFDLAIRVKDINDPTFRMKMFCWATTGAPRVMREGEPIRVSSTLIFVSAWLNKNQRFTWWKMMMNLI